MSQLTSSAPQWVRNTARIIALVWAGWWVFFGVASGVGEGLDLLGVLIHTAVPGLVFLGLAVLAWFREEIGGGLLVITSLLIIVLYPVMAGSAFTLSAMIMTLILLALPPMIAGILFLAYWRQKLTHL